MEMEHGKLFVGGISWDTNEDRLREYFQAFGEVVEAVIMKDRATGRARGFGFVVFVDPGVAERVVLEKHVIDGRTVEAKKAVPRDDQHINRNNSSNQGSPGPVRTKKIFVGGLASTVTENDFKSYFDQFGTTTDVVVMYDHQTQRPRGFGFITYESEEAVDKVLHKTFHELNGKMVEVKRAVPKELSPGPTRGHLSGYSYGLSRVSSFLNAYTQGYNPSAVGGYGVRMDGRFSPVNVGRGGYPPFSPSSYGVGLNLEPGLSPGYGGSGSINSNLGNGRGLNPSLSGISNRFGSPVGYSGSSGTGTGSVFGSIGRNMWGSTNLNYATSYANSSKFPGSGNENMGGSFGNFGSNGAIWGSSPISGQGGGGIEAADYNSGRISYGNGDNNGFGAGGGNRRTGGGSSSVMMPSLSFAASNDDIGGGAFGSFYGNGSTYGVSNWRSSSPEIECFDSFGYGIGNGSTDVASSRNTAGFGGGYSVTNRSHRGIAA